MLPTFPYPSFLAYSFLLTPSLSPSLPALMYPRPPSHAHHSFSIVPCPSPLSHRPLPAVPCPPSLAHRLSPTQGRSRASRGLMCSPSVLFTLGLRSPPAADPGRSCPGAPNASASFPRGAVHSLIFLPSLPCTGSLPFVVFLVLVSLFHLCPSSSVSVFAFLSSTHAFFCVSVAAPPSPFPYHLSCHIYFVLLVLFSESPLFLFSFFLSLPPPFFSHFSFAFLISVPISPRFDVSSFPLPSPPLLPPHSPYPLFPFSYLPFLLSEYQKEGREMKKDRSTEDERTGGRTVNGGKELE